MREVGDRAALTKEELASLRVDFAKAEELKKKRDDIAKQLQIAQAEYAQYSGKQIARRHKLCAMTVSRIKNGYMHPLKTETNPEDSK